MTAHMDVISWRSKTTDDLCILNELQVLCVLPVVTDTSKNKKLEKNQSERKLRRKQWSVDSTCKTILGAYSVHASVLQCTSGKVHIFLHVLGIYVTVYDLLDCYDYHNSILVRALWIRCGKAVSHLDSWDFLIMPSPQASTFLWTVYPLIK